MVAGMELLAERKLLKGERQKPAGEEDGASDDGWVDVSDDGEGLEWLDEDDSDVEVEDISVRRLCIAVAYCPDANTCSAALPSHASPG